MPYRTVIETGCAPRDLATVAAHICRSVFWYDDRFTPLVGSARSGGGPGEETRAFPELAALPSLLTMRQACKAVGMSYPTIRRRIGDGTLKAYRVGPREIRVDRDSLIAMVCSEPVGA